MAVRLNLGNCHVIGFIDPRLLVGAMLVDQNRLRSLRPVFDAPHILRSVTPSLQPEHVAVFE
ncbi:MAG: hypothetical protein VB875_03755, partial [Pirellulales bacterium]